MTLSDVVVECMQKPELVSNFNRLQNTNLDFTLHKPKSGLEMMIDQATGYDDIAQLTNKNKSEDIKKFIAFVADVVYIPWMKDTLDSLPTYEVEDKDIVECKRCGECCLSIPCIFAQMRYGISENNMKICPDLIKTETGYSCRLIETDEIIKGILVDGMCDKVKDKEKANESRK